MNGRYNGATTRNRTYVLNRLEELRAKLGDPNQYGEWSRYECPRCHGHATHCSEPLRLARCWDCGWSSLEDLCAGLTVRTADVPAPGQSDTRPRAVPFRPRPPTPLRVYQVPA